MLWEMWISAIHIFTFDFQGFVEVFEDKWRLIHRFSTICG